MSLIWEHNGWNNQYKTTGQKQKIDHNEWVQQKKKEGNGDKMKRRHEFMLCGDGCYIGAHRILGRRRFLPQPHHIPNHVHLPTTNPPLFAVNSVVTVPWPHCSPNLLSPHNQPPPPYTVLVVVIAIDGTRRILVWWQSLPQPHHRINWVRPHTPPPPPKKSRSRRTCDRKNKIKKW